MEAHLAKRKRNPARIPPQTPPAGGNQPRQGESKTPEKLFRPAESFFRILNQDCFGKKFGFCSGDTAKNSFACFLRTKHTNCFVCIWTRTPEVYFALAKN